MTMFGMLDCNNFYVSCERVFNPNLYYRPVVVLSNNDGNIIARSEEAKELGIPMGAPFHRWKSFCAERSVTVCSSNYELYGDMSFRVMHILQTFAEEFEFYSIDEAFFTCRSDENLLTNIHALRHAILKNVGIPVSIGIASTKTLAKVANHIAKQKRQSYIFDLTCLALQDEILKNLTVDKIWGVGDQVTKRLHKLSIMTARQLRDYDEHRIRMHFNVSIQKTVFELRGISCYPIKKARLRDEIITSRSFGSGLSRLTDLHEAITHFASIASIKLRNQACNAGSIFIFLHTNFFDPRKKQYGNICGLKFVTPTADTRHIAYVARFCMNNIYKEGFEFHRAGVILTDLIPKHIHQHDLFTQFDHAKSQSLMQMIDRIQQRFGKRKLFFCGEGMHQEWAPKTNYLSQSYTTRWDALPKVGTH